MPHETSGVYVSFFLRDLLYPQLVEVKNGRLAMIAFGGKIIFVIVPLVLI